MKKSSEIIKWGLIALAVVVAAVIITVLSNKKTKEVVEDSSSAPQSSSVELLEPESNSEPETNTPEEDTTPHTQGSDWEIDLSSSPKISFTLDLVQLQGTEGYSNPMLGYWNYLEYKNKTMQQDRDESCKAIVSYAPKMDADGNPVKIFTGHQVYTGITSDECYFTGPNQEIDFIFSGPEILHIPDTTTDSLESAGDKEYIYGYIYTEDTCKRIYILDTQEEVTAAKQAWSDGQAILRGEKEAPEGTVILNGRLINAKFDRYYDNGEPSGFLIPLAEIVPELHNGSLIDDYSDYAYIMNASSGFFTTRYFYPASSDNATLQQLYKISDGEFDVWGKPTEETPAGWNYRGKLADGPHLYAVDSDVISMLNWKIFSDGNVMLIVTDESEYSNIFLLNEDAEYWTVITANE